MDRVDVLGVRPERHKVFSSALLAEAEDHELTAIVEEAARELSAPIALVNLVLEQIQFFKAHYGLPSDLAVARGTDRDVSFCQFVVQTGMPFEVTDAERDERVPQRLVKQYGIRSYLGIPVIADDIVVGSLCVLDMRPRVFSDEERRILEQLATLANRRLSVMSKRRRDPSAILVDQVMQPVLAELRNCLAPMHAAVATGHLATAAVAPALRLGQHMVSGGITSTETMKQILDAAQRALDDCESSLYEIEVSIGDTEDSLTALEHALTNASVTRLSTLAVSGRELARYNVAAIGGVVLPDLVEDPVVSTPRSLGVTLVATCLSLFAAQMAKQNVFGGLRMDTQVLGARAAIAVSTNGLPDSIYQEIAAELSDHIGSEPTVAIQAADGAMGLFFAVVQSA